MVDGLDIVMVDGVLVVRLVDDEHKREHEQERVRTQVRHMDEHHVVEVLLRLKTKVVIRKRVL